MNLRFVSLMLVAALLVGAAPAQAKTIVDLTMDEGPYVVGQTVSLTGQLFLSCDEHEEGDVLNFTLLNQEDVPWAIAESKSITFSLESCEPGGQSIGETVDGETDNLGIYNIPQVTTTFFIDGNAPAFETSTLSFGVVDTENEGGDFDIEVGYNPAFKVPSSIAFDMESAAATATLGIATAANADSSLQMEILRFDIDGAEPPSDAEASVATSVDVPSSAAGNPPIHTVSVELDISTPAMAGEEVYRWGTAEVALQFTMVADADASKKSDPQTVVMTFTNTNPDTVPLSDEGGKGTPGFPVIAILAALGLVAALRRRA